MWISKLHLKNIRGFEDSLINPSKTMNVFVGPNNSGKSTLLNSILLLQKNHFKQSDVSLLKTEGSIDVYFENPGVYFPNIAAVSFSNGSFEKILRFEIGDKKPGRKHIKTNLGSRNTAEDIPSIEPKNLIYPYLSKRKVTVYSEVINESTSNSVVGNFENLYSKIDRLSNPYFKPGFGEYQKACEDIIGFPISTIASPSGKRAALIVQNLSHIPLTSMGEGVANLLGLIVDLCMAENKVFLIEEPENDIHPKALKALLALIEKKSANNQFFISTHSNIVTKYLAGKQGAKVFSVNMNFAQDSLMPISIVKEISNDTIERQKVLEDLGYEFYDYDLWKSWLFLEESSAEVIIRDYLIDWFVKPLKNKIRTFSAGGISEIETKFEDFDRLFVFLHLEPTYKNKVWVLVDSGEDEEKIISRMKEKYVKSGWEESAFSQFSQHDFEMYYPESFRDKVDQVLSINNKKDKRQAKKKLLDEVKLWINENPDEAKEQFKESAKEVIEKLKLISKEVNKTN